ncbi:hypothetical protein MVEN_01897800 [Mycena venus]|uniref:Uncharacterized protein n=1 Tax=Mycena venus TaxID=2733690 RepID=A0A8H6XEB5_9AGAR|nr:hypothetical protein MVEN_01897800 [Mycena venus]
MSGVPPLASSGVFSVGDSVLINAPREKVWKILLDFPSYEEWNPYTRTCTFVSESGSAIDDQTLGVGKLFVSRANLPPAGLTPPRQSGSSRITTLDHDNFRVAWVTPGLLAWFLFVERWTMLTVVDGKTKWETFEVFSGILAYIVYWVHYKNLLLAFRAMAEALKSRRSCTIISESGSIVEDQTLAEGKLFVTCVNLPPEMTPPRYKGTTLDHDNFRVAWETPGFMSWFVNVER